MTSRVAVVVRQVDATRPVLAEYIAGEIPVETAAGAGNARVARLGDDPVAISIHVLKHEGDIVTGNTPIANEKRVRVSVEIADLRMFEL